MQKILGVVILRRLRRSRKFFGPVFEAKLTLVTVPCKRLKGNTP